MSETDREPTGSFDDPEADVYAVVAACRKRTSIHVLVSTWSGRKAEWRLPVRTQKALTFILTSLLGQLSASGGDLPLQLAKKRNGRATLTPSTGFRLAL